MAELVTQAGYPAGVNNVSPDQALPRGEDGVPLAARELVNVDLVAGKPRTRPGRALLASGDWHSPGSLKGGACVGVRDGDLCNALTLDVLRAGVGPGRVTYAEVQGDLWWSNGALIRRLRRADLADLTIGPDGSGAPNAEAIAGGGLPAGSYVVAATWFDADGRESGAWGSIEVEVTDGQGIRVFDIPVPESAVTCRLYLSAPNGDELYAAKDMVAGVTNTTLTSSDERHSGRALETLWHAPFPPCERLRWFNGRLYGVTGRNTLVWSPALRPHLHHPDAYLREGVEITLLEPLENAGIWMANHKATYWLSGTDPKKDWRRLIKSDHAAVPGASIVVPGTIVGLETTADVAVWLSADGVFCAGTADGTLIRLTEQRLALPPGEAGSIMLREADGLRQLVASYQSRGTNGMVFQEKVVGTVTRHS